MRVKLLFVGVITVIFIGILLSGGHKSENASVEGVKTQSQDQKYVQVQANSLTSQTKQMGVVSVEITPIKLELGQDMAFEMALNNHSIDLSYDFMGLVTAKDDKGNIYKPVNWTGNSGGHHVRGEMQFQALNENAKEIGLTVKGVDDQEATYEWSIE